MQSEGRSCVESGSSVAVGILSLVVCISVLRRPPHSFFPGPRACTTTTVQLSSKDSIWHEHHLDEQRAETANELLCFLLGVTRETSPTWAKLPTQETTAPGG
ncbi:unnamed protein product [Ectocarpus sp. 12 AP-2014]